MRFLSVCSGIEAASVAWEQLGWRAVAYSEIDPFACAVLAHHYPDVPNLGDMTKVDGRQYRGAVDILVAGPPCQSFSVAGLRRGLQDERGNLALEFVRIADESAPAFVVWENVPGILSDRGNAFGCFLGALAGEASQLEPPGGRWANAGYVLGPGRAIAWRTLDAQYFGLAQRRKRVFLVACPRSGADPRKVLFEYGGLRRDSAPSRKAGEDVASTLESGPGRSRGAGTPPPGVLIATQAPAVIAFHGSQDPDVSGDITHPVCSNYGLETCVCYTPEIVSQAVSAKWSKRASGPAGDEYHNLVVTQRHIRRLIPAECESLMGFLRGYTDIIFRGKPAADGPRYRAIGNSMAVPVMRWIGERIQLYGE